MERNELTGAMPSAFFSSFIAGEPPALSFLPADFRSGAARIDRARRAARRRIAPGLLEVLERQNREYAPSSAREANLSALASPGTVAVVTGQQVGLFLGPLYAFYKAASAVAAARKLEQESGIRCIPIFWLQTEDHDYQEINHCDVVDPGSGPLRLLLTEEQTDPAQARASVKHRQIGPGIQSQLSKLEETLGRLPHAAQMLSLLRQEYRPDRSLCEAFAGAMAALFAEEGLILLDPREQSVAALLGKAYSLSLRSYQAIAQALVERSRALTQAGFETQVHVRDDSPLFFFHAQGPAGPRFRLQRRDSGWLLVGTEQTLSDQELQRVLQTEPLRFSSSALLRPILQDLLLPTAAYVGGPAEVSYYAQLAPLYEFFELSPPLIIPRARFRCIEPHTRTLLDKLHLRPSDVERPREQVALRVEGSSPVDYPTPEAVRGQLMSEFSRNLTQFEARAPAIDLNLLKSIRRTRGTVERAVTRLVDRYARSLLERNRVAMDRIDRLQASLFPQGSPQERVYSLPYFACRYGVGELKRKVFESLDPFAGEIRDLQL